MTTVGQFEAQSPAQARAFWPAIRAQLEQVRARYGDGWMPDDVWAEILVGNAYLWTVGEPEAPEAWVVLQIHARSYDGRGLHIWQAGENTDARAADYWPQILAIAAEANCQRVTIETPRRWERALPGATLRYLYTFDVGG